MVCDKTEYWHSTCLEVTEMKMCRWACGHTLRDHVRNENIKERLKVESIAERCRKARLRWFGHVKRRDQDYVGRKTLEMVPPGRRKRGRQFWSRDGWWQPSERRKTRSMSELAGGELCLPQRPHNQVGAARRKRRILHIKYVFQIRLKSTHYCGALVLFHFMICLHKLQLWNEDDM